MKTGIHIDEKDGLKRVILENNLLRAELIPEIGGKMSSLYYKPSGREMLLQPQNEGGIYRRAEYGDPFDSYDTSGFDECFPTVEAAEYPMAEGSDESLHFPDHGELWSIPWNYKQNGEQVMLAVKGHRWDYDFRKKVSLNSNRLEIEYRLSNNSSKPFFYIWSAHPLLQVEPGDRLLFHTEIKDVFLNWTSDKSIGRFGDRLEWPHLSQQSETKYSTVQE
ncbi:MAG: hypothetical protein WAN36_12975, partial [Calditrichia bacterium]